MNALALRMLEKIYPVKGRHVRPAAAGVTVTVTKTFFGLTSSKTVRVPAPAVLVDAFLPFRPCFAAVPALDASPVAVQALTTPSAARAARVLARTSR